MKSRRTSPPSRYIATSTKNLKQEVRLIEAAGGRLVPGSMVVDQEAGSVQFRYYPKG